MFQLIKYNKILKLNSQNHKWGNILSRTNINIEINVLNVLNHIKSY